MSYPYGNQNYYNRRYGNDNKTEQKRIGYAPVVSKPIVPKPTKFGRPKGETFTISGVKGFPDVIISHKAHSKMWSLVQECDIEVSWLSTVIRHENGDFYIKDVFVPLQECGPATTEMTPDGEAEMMMELVNAGLGAELGLMHCWGHSHVNMDTGSSMVDEDQTDTFVAKFPEHFVRFIGNKRGDLNCHVYLKNQGITLNQPKIIVESDKDDETDYRAWAQEQIEAKVERRVYVYNPASKSKNFNAGSYYYGQGSSNSKTREPYEGYEGWANFGQGSEDTELEKEHDRIYSEFTEDRERDEFFNYDKEFYEQY